MKLRHVPLTLSFTLVTSLGCADEPAPEAIDAVFADYDTTQTPGCTLGVYRDDAIVYARGYGMANLEYGIALAPDSVFRMASVSKQFVAAAIALLDEAGELDLDDPVRKYFPDLPDYGAPVTLRHLVHHTSGIRDYLELAWLADWGEWYTTDEALRLIQRQQALNFPPGSDYLYSNSGYLMLAEVVRQVTGKTLREWADARMFQPLGMRDSHFHDDHTHLVPRRATGYARGDSGWHTSMTQLDMVGDGGLYSTVNDLLHWHANFADNRLGKGRGQLIGLLETPAVLNDGEDTGYGFGLGIGEFRGTREVEHGGAFVGYRTALHRFPEHDLGIAVLCNRADADPTTRAREVAALYLPDAGNESSAAAPDTGNAADGIVLSAEQLEPYAGDYWNEERLMRRRIVLEDGGLYYDRDGWGRSPLVPVGTDTFRMDDAPVAVTVTFDDATAIVDVEGEPPLVLTRYDPEALRSVDLNALAGTWYSPELDHRQRLAVEDGRLVAERRGGPQTLEPLPGERFIAEGVVLEVDRDAADAITGFRLHSGRVRNLAYQRPEPEVSR